MKNVLIVGGAGFIGSHLVKECLSSGARVSVYDNLSAGRREFLPESADLKYFEGDILDREKLNACFGEASPEVVYHLAALHHIPTCEAHPDLALKVNVEGLQSVLSISADMGAGKVVFCSSGAVYDISETALDEEHPLRPRDVYGISKSCGEDLIWYFTQKTGRNAVIARLFNTVGRNETNAHLVPDLMSQLADGKREISLGNLEPKRDYIHVEDVARALFASGEKKMSSMLEVLNIGSGIEYSVLELVKMCEEVVGWPIKVISRPEMRRKIDRPTQLADISRAKSYLGWNPKLTLMNALEDIWGDYKNGYRVRPKVRV